MSVLSSQIPMPCFPDLAGKVALVTGGSRGIGAVTCQYLAANGVRVVVNGRDAQCIEATLAAIRAAGGEAIGVVADCTDAAAIEHMRQQIAHHYGAPDILATFAGGDGMPQPIETISEERWDEVMAVNLTAKFLTIKSFLPAMKARRSGTIIMMSSSAGRATSGASLMYAAAQAGTVMIAKNLAQQLGPHGIRVNCLAPSAVRNEKMEATMSDEQKRHLAAAFPLGRFGEPADVAAATLFLASTASSWLSGVTLDLAGGRIIV